MFPQIIPDMTRALPLLTLLFAWTWGVLVGTVVGITSFTPSSWHLGPFRFIVICDVLLLVLTICVISTSIDTEISFGLLDECSGIALLGFLFSTLGAIIVRGQKPLHVFVRDSNTNTTYAIDVAENDTISTLKYKVMRKMNSKSDNIDSIELIIKEKGLENNKLICDYGLTRGSVLDTRPSVGSRTDTGSTATAVVHMQSATVVQEMSDQDRGQGAPPAASANAPSERFAALTTLFQSNAASTVTTAGEADKQQLSTLPSSSSPSLPSPSPSPPLPLPLPPLPLPPPIEENQPLLIQTCDIGLKYGCICSRGGYMVAAKYQLGGSLRRPGNRVHLIKIGGLNMKSRQLYPGDKVQLKTNDKFVSIYRGWWLAWSSSTARRSGCFVVRRAKGQLHAHPHAQTSIGNTNTSLASPGLSPGPGPESGSGYGSGSGSGSGSGGGNGFGNWFGAYTNEGASSWESVSVSNDNNDKNENGNGNGSGSGSGSGSISFGLMSSSSSPFSPSPSPGSGSRASTGAVMGHRQQQRHSQQQSEDRRQKLLELFGGELGDDSSSSSGLPSDREPIREGDRFVLESAKFPGYVLGIGRRPHAGLSTAKLRQYSNNTISNSTMGTNNNNTSSNNTTTNNTSGSKNSGAGSSVGVVGAHGVTDSEEVFLLGIQNHTGTTTTTTTTNNDNNNNNNNNGISTSMRRSSISSGSFSSSSFGGDGFDVDDGGGIGSANVGASGASAGGGAGGATGGSKSKVWLHDLVLQAAPMDKENS